jgi:primosomal protein N' (replication factor Y)
MNDMKFISFASNYYQYPIGKVISAALPTQIKKGFPLISYIDQLSLTNQGKACSTSNLKKSAPKQAELLEILKIKVRLNEKDLNNLSPNWRRYYKGLIEKKLVKKDRVINNYRVNQKYIRPSSGPELNSEQANAVNTIINEKKFKTFLIDGVTGSGKTEVYLHLIKNTLKDDKQCLILVPEIGLTSQFINRIIKRIGLIPHQFHSSCTENEKLITWKAIRDSKAKIVLGTRSAIFSPFKNLGIIIVDEENDVSYKQQEGFRYSARDLAIIKAKHCDIPVILGSATPSIESINQCKKNIYSKLKLSERAGPAKLPSMHLIDINKNKTKDGISDLLLKTMNEHLKKDGQILIFVNRRGYAPTLICKSCNYIEKCKRCDSRMTVYQSKNSLICHHCGSKEKLKTSCHLCGSEYVALGQGTQRIESALNKHFSSEWIMRIDSDSTKSKGSLDKALEAAKSGTAKILIGTQMLSKGHHFSSLTLVAIINADQGLFSNDFRGSERLAQSITQVAGRAGRENKKGQVLIQTEYPDHPFWETLFKGGYKSTIRLILEERKQTGWPPYSYIALLRTESHQKKFTWEFLKKSKLILSSDKSTIDILGPVSAPMEKKAGKYRGQLLLQSNNRKILNHCITSFIQEIESKKITRRVKWSLDIDPIELF